MGINRVLVKSVFSRSRSIETHDSNMRSNAAERRRWSSVRSYLCGDEFNSVAAEEDSASVRSSKATEFTRVEFSSVFAEDSGSAMSSEATVTQPMHEGIIRNEKIEEDKQNSTSELFRKDDAAVIIQSAFRSFLARRRNRLDLIEESKCNVVVTGTGSPSRDSVGTSIEVQTGNSTEVFSLHEESMGTANRMHQKGRSQVWKLKEDWDDSTLSSNIIKMRIQNRVEATTRRERALAYAFSQQLRICSKKRPTRSDGTEANMGWSWLERWMATRQQENSISDVTKQVDMDNNINQRSSAVRKRLIFDGTGEEKESCGSNEVSIQLDNEFKRAHTQLKFKPASISRRKTVPSYQVCKRESSKEDERNKKYKGKQGTSKNEAICEDGISQVSRDHVNNLEV